MGRLSPFRISLGLVVVFLFFITPNNAAPVQESAVSPSGSDKGCFFMDKHYPSGQTIDTNDKCLNCTCAGNALMCYLRVCPFIKPLNEHCKVEKHPEECCPKYYCLEAYPRVTTPKPDEETRGCYVNGLYLDEGARIPMDPLKPCEACYCIRNTSVCTLQTCKLDIEGCKPQFRIGSCCPSRYNCTDEAATTVPPGIMEPEDYEGCRYHGILYKNGEQVSSPDKCQQCYCMKHEVVCTVKKCQAPSPSCLPLETPEGECCPEKYDCPSGTEIPDSALVHMVTTEEDLFKPSTTEMPQTRLAAASVTSSIPEDESSEVAGMSSMSESETMFPTTKGVRRIDDEDAFTTIPALEAEVSTETDLVSRPRIPKITEAPDDMFTSAVVPKITTGRPTFYVNRTIPGEGGCFYENRTYHNREQFVSVDPCKENCTCINSVVNCNIVECFLIPPQSGAKCKVKKNADECCPKYVCDVSESTSSPRDAATPEQQTIVEIASDIKPQEIIPDSFESTTKSDVPLKTTSTLQPDQQTEFVPTVATEKVSTSSEILETVVDTKQQETAFTTTKFSSEDTTISSTISEIKTTIDHKVSLLTSTTEREETTTFDETMESDVSTLKDIEIKLKNFTTAFTEITPQSDISTHLAETIKISEATPLKPEIDIGTESIEISTTSLTDTSLKSETSAVTTVGSLTVPQVITLTEEDVLGETSLPDVAIAGEVKKTPSDTTSVILTEVTSSETPLQSVKPLDQTITSSLDIETETAELGIKESESTNASVDETLSTTKSDSFTSEKEISMSQTEIITEVADDVAKDKTKAGIVTVSDSTSTDASTVKVDLSTTVPKEIHTSITDLKSETEEDELLKKTTLKTQFTKTTLLQSEATDGEPHTSTIPTIPSEIMESETPFLTKTETEEKSIPTLKGEVTDELSTKLKWITPEISAVTSTILPETSRVTGIFKLTDDEETETMKIQSTDMELSTVSLIKLTTDEIKMPMQTDTHTDLESQTTFSLDAETSSDIDKTAISQTTKILTPESVETLPTTVTMFVKEKPGILTTPETAVFETEMSIETKKDSLITDIMQTDISKDLMTTVASTTVKAGQPDTLETSTQMSHTVTQKLLTESEEEKLGDKSTKSEFVTVTEIPSSFIDDTETSSTIHDKTEFDMSTLTQEAETKLPSNVSDTKDIATSVSHISQTDVTTEEQQFESSLSMETSIPSQVDIKSTPPVKTGGEITDLKPDEEKISTLEEISLQTEKAITVTKSTVVPTVAPTLKASSDTSEFPESADTFEPPITVTSKLTDLTKFSTISKTSTEPMESEITMNTLAITHTEEETTSEPDISIIKATEIFEEISTSDKLETDSKPSIVTTIADKLPTKPSTLEFSQTETEKSPSISLSVENITSEISTISITNETNTPSIQTTSSTLHSESTKTEVTEKYTDEESTKLDSKMSTTSVTTEVLLTGAISTLLAESVKDSDAKGETVISTETTKPIDTVSVKTTILDLLDVTTVEPKDTSSERTTMTMREETQPPSTESLRTTDSIEHDMKEFTAKDITIQSDLPKTTEQVFPKLSTMPGKTQEQEVTTVSTSKTTEVTEQASSTQDTEISTESILTPIKHIPDSLILDNTTTHSPEMEGTTSVLISEINETETTAKVLDAESFETEEADISTIFTAENYTEISETGEIQLTRVTDDEILKIGTSSELPVMSSTVASIATTLDIKSSSTSEDFIAERSTVLPEDIQFEVTKDETASDLPFITETSGDLLGNVSTLSTETHEITASRSSETTMVPDKHVSTLFVKDSSESEMDKAENVTDGKVITTSEPIFSTKLVETEELGHITKGMDTDLPEISTSSTEFVDKTSISIEETSESILTSELLETTSSEDQTKSSVPKFTSDVTLDAETPKIEEFDFVLNETQTKESLSSTFVKDEATTESLINNITADQQNIEVTSILSTTLKQETDRVESHESTTKQDFSSSRFTTEDRLKISAVTTEGEQFPLSTLSSVMETDIGIKKTTMTLEPLGSTTERIINITDAPQTDIITRTDVTKLPETETSTLLLADKMPTLSSDGQELEKSTKVTVEPIVSPKTTETAFTSDITETASLHTTDMRPLTTVDKILDVSKSSVEISLTTEVKLDTFLTDSTHLPVFTTDEKQFFTSIVDETKTPSSTDEQEDMKSELTKVLISEQTLKAETSTESFADSISTEDQKPTMTEIDQFSEGTEKDISVSPEEKVTTIPDSKTTISAEVSETPHVALSDELKTTSNITITTEDVEMSMSLRTKQVTVTLDRSTEGDVILSTSPVSESEKITTTKISEESASTMAITTHTPKPFINGTPVVIDTEITMVELTTASDKLSSPTDIFESQPTEIDTEKAFVSTKLPHISASTFSADDKNVSTDSFSIKDEEIEIKSVTPFVEGNSTEISADTKTLSSAFIPEKEFSTSPDKMLVTQISTSTPTFIETASETSESLSTLVDKVKLTTETLTSTEEETTELRIDSTNTSQTKEISSLADKEISTPIFTSVGTSEEIIVMTTTMSSTLDGRLETKVRTAFTPEILQTLPSVEPMHGITENETLLDISKSDISITTVTTEKDITISSIKDDLITEQNITVKPDQMFTALNEVKETLIVPKDQVTLFSTESVSTSKITLQTLDDGQTVTMSSQEISEKVDEKEITDFTSFSSNETSSSTEESHEIISSTISISTPKEDLLQETKMTDDSSMLDSEAAINATDSSIQPEDETKKVLSSTKLDAGSSVTESTQLFDSTEKEAVTTQIPKVVVVETKTPEVTEQSVVTNVSPASTTITNLSTGAKTDSEMTSTIASKFMDTTTKEIEVITKPTSIQTEKPGEHAISIATEVVDTSTEAEISVPTADIELSTDLLKESISVITTHQKEEIPFTSTAKKSELTTSTTLDLRDTTMITEKVFIPKTDKFDTSVIVTTDSEAVKEISTSESQTTEPFLPSENATQPEIKTSVAFTTIDEKAIVTDRVTETMDGKESTKQTTIEILKITSPIEKEETTVVTKETPEIKDSETRMTTDSSKSDTVPMTTKISAFDKRTEIDTIEDTVVTKMDVTPSTTEEEFLDGEISTRTTELEDKTKLITDILDRDITIDTTSTERIITKSPEVLSTLVESTDSVTDKILDISKEITNTVEIQKYLTTEKVSETSDSTIKLTDIEKTQETVSDVIEKVTAAVESTEKDMISIDILDEKKPVITTVEFSTHGTEDFSSQKITTVVTEGDLIPSSTVSSDMLTKKADETLTETEKESLSTVTIPITDADISEISGDTDLLTKELKSTELSTTVQSTKIFSPVSDTTKLESTEFLELTTKIPVTDSFIETEIVTLPEKLTTLKTDETTTGIKSIDAITKEFSTEIMTEHEIQTDTTTDFETSRKISTEKLDTMEGTKMAEPENDTEITASSKEILTTLSEITMIQSTTIIPRKTTVVDTATSTPKTVTDITALDEDESLLKATDFKTTTEAESPEKVPVSPTTLIVTTKVVPKTESSSELPITFSSKFNFTTDIIPQKESELTPKPEISILEAETTSTDAIAEHTVITEETILSNITFAADAMIVTTSPTSDSSKTSLDNGITSTTDRHSVTEIASTSSSLIPMQFETSIGDSETSQDTSSKDMIPVKLGTTPSAAQTVKEDEEMYKTTSEIIMTEAFVTTEPIAISQEIETTDIREDDSKRIPTKVSTQFTTETPITTSESMGKVFDITTLKPMDIKLSVTDHDVVETGKTIEDESELVTEDTTVDIAASEVTLSKTTEKKLISSTTAGIKIVTSTISRNEAEIETSTSLLSTEDFEVSNLTLKSTTVKKEDEATFTFADTTKSDAFTPEKVTLATEIKSTVTAQADVIITTEKQDETVSQDSLTSQISQDEKMFTLLPRTTSTTLQPPDTSVDIAHSETTEEIVSRHDERPGSTTIEVTTHLPIKVSETSATAKSDAQVTDKEHTVFEGTTAEPETFITERSTETVIPEIITKQSDFTTKFDTFSKDMHKTDTLSQTLAPVTESGSTENITAQPTDKVSTTQLLRDSVTEKEEALSTKLSEKITTVVKPLVETIAPLDLQTSSSKDVEKGFTTTPVTTVEELSIYTAEKSSTEIDVKFPSTTKPSSHLAETDEVKIDSISTVETVKQETSSEITTTEKLLVTESTSSTATTVPSDTVTDAGISELGLTTDSIQKEDASQETVVMGDDRIFTEATTLEETNDCFFNGTFYNDAQAITTIDPCEKCHCSSGEIICFKILCKMPKEGCKPTSKMPSECCPSSYECPEEDTESTTVRREFTVKDVTTPIPISFMFSTMPSSIASTVLVTKQDESGEITKKPTESVTDKELQTISVKDVLFSVTEIQITDKTVKEEAPSTDLTFDKVGTQPPDTEVTQKESKISATSELDFLSTTSFPSMDTQRAQTLMETSVSTYISTSVKHELVSTFEEPKDVTSSEKEIFTLSSEQGTTLEVSETDTVKDHVTTVSKDESISEVTIQSTEIPTTLHKTQTTFTTIHADKDEEFSLSPENITKTSLKTDVTKLTSKLQPMTPSVTVSATDITTLSEIETAKAVTSAESTDVEKMTIFTSTAFTDIESKMLTSIESRDAETTSASSDIDETKEFASTETTDSVKIKTFTSPRSPDFEKTKEFESTETMNTVKTKAFTSTVTIDMEKAEDSTSFETTDIEKKDLNLTAATDTEKTKAFTSTVPAGVEITKDFTSISSADIDETKAISSTEIPDIVLKEEFTSTASTDEEMTKEFSSSESTDIMKTKEFSSTVSIDMEKANDFASTTVIDTEKTKVFTSSVPAGVEITKDFTSISSTDIDEIKAISSTEIPDIMKKEEFTSTTSTDEEMTKEFGSTETTDIMKTKEFSSAVSIDMEKAKDFTSTTATDTEKTKTFPSTVSSGIEITKDFTSISSTDIDETKAILSTEIPVIVKKEEFTSTTSTDEEMTKEFSSSETTDIMKTKEFSSTVSIDMEKAKDFTSTAATDTEKTKTFASTVSSGVEISKDFTSISSTDIDETKAISSTEIPDIVKKEEFTSTASTDEEMTKEFSSSETTDIMKTKEFSSTVSIDMEKAKDFTSTAATDTEKTKTFTSTVSSGVEISKDFTSISSTDIDETKAISSTEVPDIVKKEEFTSTTSTDEEMTKEFSSTETTDIMKAKEFSSAVSLDMEKAKDFTSTTATDTEKTKAFTSTVPPGIEITKDFTLISSSDIDETKAISSTAISDIVKKGEFTSAASTDEEKTKEISSTETMDIMKAEEFTSTVSIDMEKVKDFSSTASEDTEKTKDFTLTEIAEIKKVTEFPSTETADILKLKESTSTTSIDMDKAKDFTSTVTTDIEKTRDFTSTETVDVEKSTEFSTSEMTDIVKVKDFTSISSTDIEKKKEVTSTVSTDIGKAETSTPFGITDIEEQKGSTLTTITDIERTKEFTSTKSIDIDVTKDFSPITSTDIEKDKELSSTAITATDKESPIITTDTKDIESTSQDIITKGDIVSTMGTVTKDDFMKASEQEDITKTTAEKEDITKTTAEKEDITKTTAEKEDITKTTAEKEDITEQVTTLSPDKLTKLGDATAITVETSSKTSTTVFVESDEVTMGAETSQQEFFTKEIIFPENMTEIPVKETKSTEKEIITTAIPVRTLLPDTSSTSSTSHAETSSQRVEFTTDKQFDEKTKETDLPTTLSSLLTSSKSTSLDMFTSDKKIITETTKSLVSTSTIKSEGELLDSEHMLEITKIDTDFDVDNKTEIKTSTTPVISRIPSATNMTTDFEIVTETLEPKKIITVLDREGTVLTMEKEPGRSTISTSEATLVDTSPLVTTESKHEENETTLFTGVTDTIFTFVSTRFTDLMKEITDLTTAKPDKETQSTSIEDKTILTLGFSTGKTAESFTPLIPLTRRIDLDIESSTTEESAQKAETAKSTVPETSTQKFVTKLMVEETSKAHVEGKETSEIDVIIEDKKITSDDILTTIASIMTSPKSETMSLVSESDEDIASTAASTEKVFDSSVPDRTEEDIATDKSTHEPVDGHSRDIFTTLHLITTSSFEDRETPRTTPETAVTETTETKISTLLSNVMVDNISSIQEETSKPIQEFKTDSTVHHSTMTSTTPERKTISDSSFTETDVASTKSPLTSSVTKSLLEITEQVSESERPITIEVTEKRKEITISDTDKPSRATRKDMGLETTPISFTKMDMDSTVKKFEEKDESTSDISQEINATLSTSRHDDTTESLQSESSTEKMEIPPLTLTNVTDNYTTVGENDTFTTLESHTDSLTSSESTTKHTEDITTVSREKTTAFEEEQKSTIMTRFVPITDVTSDITTSSVEKDLAAADVVKTTSDSTVTEKEFSTAGTFATERETEVKDLETQKETSKPVGITVVPDSASLTTFFTEKSTASVRNDTVSHDMLTTEKGTTIEDLETQKATPKPMSTTESQLAETVTAFTNEKSTVSVAADTSSTMTLAAENKTVVEDLEMQTTSEPITTTFVLQSETKVASSTERSTVSVTTDMPSSSTLVTQGEVKDNATEIITKGFKAIETTPISFTTTPEPSVRDSETTTAEEDYAVDENTCIFQGRLFQSAEQIPRVDPCEFCFCFRGDIICLQQSCPPPAPDCNETRIAGFCCPRYECPVYLTSKNMTLFNRRKGQQVQYIQQRRIDKREIRPTIEVKGCQINGTFYELGKTVTSASGPCLHCVCQGDGLMHCDPQRCKPQPPLMLKMNNSFFRRR